MQSLAESLVSDLQCLLGTDPHYVSRDEENVYTMFDQHMRGRGLVDVALVVEHMPDGTYQTLYLGLHEDALWRFDPFAGNLGPGMFAVDGVTGRYLTPADYADSDESF